MDLGRLLHPRSVAVVGATEREDSYAGQTLLNLASAGFPGPVWGVNPGRTEVYGRPCFPALSELPETPDAVVVAIPAAGVPAVIEEAGALGCGGAVVYGAGFGEMAAGAAAMGGRLTAGGGEATAGAEYERALHATALRHGLPICGPNGNGIVALHERAALWGDALPPLEAGRVALVSQSGNLAVNALTTRRGLRLHTVVSCGNSVAPDPADWVLELAGERDVGSIALYLEGDGDGERLCEAFARCAENGVRVAVLKVGASAAGSAAAAAHTGAVAGDQHVFRALVEEAGAAWAADAHELLELAKALAVPGPRRSRPERVLAVLTCSGGDSALAADEAERLGLPLARLGAQTRRRLRELVPRAATIGNPLDYTALIWGEVETLRDIVAAVGDDPAVERVLVLYDQPVGIDGAPEQSWAAVREGILAGATASGAPVMVAATLPELLDDAAAARFAATGVPAVSGLRTGLACAAALGRPAADPARLRDIAATRRSAAPGGRIDWLPEHEAKELLRAAEMAVVEGRTVDGEDDAVAALAEFGGSVAVKLAAPSVRHKSDGGALVLDVRAEDDLRAAHRRLTALGLDGGRVVVERMAPPGAELLVSARSDAVVPCLVVGAGGVWTELLADAAVIPLPASPERVEEAIRALRAAPLFIGGRGRPALDVAAAARLASAAGELLLESGLELTELNPVVVHQRGAIAVDAVAAGRTQ
ncbi:MAG TPA: acetate--CoA ligase family protein [Thermoleophilaceae bacterium]